MSHALSRATADTQPRPLRCVLVVGANGFLGGFIVAALRTAGFDVVRGIRLHGRAPAADERDCDLARMHDADDWRAALRGIDAVVNAAGILRETGAQRFDAIHVDGPLALARACVDAGIARFVQVSALGHADDGGFIASKHRFDDALLALPLQAVVLRPSVVYAAAGSYGGTSLLRALAAMPLAQWLPGDGRWPLQPVAAEDLAALVVRALQAPPGLYEVGGPEVLSLREYQAHWRRWLRISGTRAVCVPEALVTLQVELFERFGRGPVGRTMWRMLRRGNVLAEGQFARLQAAFGDAPRALQDALAARPSQVQDRWHAQLYFVAPLLRAGLVVLWLLSAWAGFATPAAQVEAMVRDTPLAAAWPVALARAGAALDLLLGLWLAGGWRPRLALVLMALSVVAYTLAFGVAAPGAWLDPLGGLAKNLALLPAIMAAWVLADRR